MFLYPKDYWSTTVGKPSKDTNNFEIKTATEAGGYTTVQFERDPETSDTVKDVQFMVILNIPRQSYKFAPVTPTPMLA